MFWMFPPESIAWFFLRARLSRDNILWLLAPYPSPGSKLDRRHTGRRRNRDNLLTVRGVGRVWARSQIIRPQEILVLYKSFHTLWCPLSTESEFMSGDCMMSVFCTTQACLFFLHVLNLVKICYIVASFFEYFLSPFSGVTNIFCVSLMSWDYTSEPVFVNLVRSPGIDSQPGWIDSLESITGLLKRLQIRAQGPNPNRELSMGQWAGIF